MAAAADAAGWAATVAGEPIPVAEVDAREAALRAGPAAATLPRPHTAEGRQLRRWLTQVIAAERVVATETTTGTASAGAEAGRTPAGPTLAELLPDVVARLDLGSVAAETLRSDRGRAVFVHVTAAVRIDDEVVADYRRRYPARLARSVRGPDGWHRPAEPASDTGCAGEALDDTVAAHLLAAARRRAYRRWLDARCAELVVLAPGYEHPGDPRQPDNVHRH